VVAVVTAIEVILIPSDRAYKSRRELEQR